MSVLTKLKNPYREAFDKYMAPSNLRYGFEWEIRTDWHHGDGYAGPKWERHMEDTYNTHMARRYLTAWIAFSVPTDEAIRAVAALSPIIEIGAGTGYWAWMLEHVGADVLAFDYKLTDNDYTEEGVFWTEVRHGDETEPGNHPERALLLCWPPYDSDMGINCLHAYEGHTLAYVGEHYGGCCANDAFFAELDHHWEQVEEYGLPQWYGMHDYLTIWRR